MDEMIEKTKLFAENSPYFTEKVVFLHAITPIIKNDMPEQITPLSTLYLLLHGAGTAVSVVLCLYLLLCRGKAIAPDITPPARLRRWAATLFGVMALAHVWWMLFYMFSDDTRSVVYGLLVAIDCMVLPPVFVGTLLTMLQDIRRPYDPEQDLWAGHCRGLHYIYGGGRETIWAVAARQLCRPGAQGSVDQPDAAHRSHDTDHEL